MTTPSLDDSQAPTLESLAQAFFKRAVDVPIVEYEKRWYSYGELGEIAQQLRTQLAASQANANAPIAFAPRNRPSALAILLALIAESRPIHMIYAFQSSAGIARDLTSLQPAVLIAYAQDISDEVRSTAKDNGTALLVIDDEGIRGEPGLTRVAQRTPTSPTVQREIQILTSGTTGAPKRFPVPYTLIANYLTRGRALFASHGAKLSQIPPVLLSFPLGNITGIYSTVPTLLLGQRVVLLDRFTLDGWLDHVRRFQPAQTGLPPSGIQMILDADVPKADLACIQSLGTGAAPLDPGVQQEFESRYNIPILLSYGATEFGGRVTAMTPEMHRVWGQSKLGSVGKPVPGARIRVVDPGTHQVLPDNQEGLLEVVSPHVGPEWIRTTDIGLVDSDGLVFLHGRADGAITRGGFKILPEAIERALAKHPAVYEAAVVGLPDRRLGQVPAAAVQLKQGVEPPSIETLAAHLRLHLLATHIPVHWRFVDALPRTPSTKIHRPGVRALFAA